MKLCPYPIGALIRRMFSELDRKGRIFDLPADRFVLGDPKRDFSVSLHGRTAATPYGPAAGPHTQLAQNIVLAWLSGARIIELKTVQIKDGLDIPRPCIDVQTIGFNIEWSQELTLEQSLEEYVKAAMLVQMLAASGKVPLRPNFAGVVFDMSVGYDLEGITSDRVQAFVMGMKNARRTVERLRRQIPDEFKAHRDLPFPASVSDSVTLSTFHGCPPREIERIGEFLLERAGLHCVVKLNPTLLGKAEVHRLLHDALGYDNIRIPDGAFDRDTTWQQAEELVGRLGRLAASLELGFGVKFANTLVVENHRDVFPRAERTMYLSGAPLHVLAMHLVRRLRRQFGDQVPVSFSGGIDRTNFADAVALGLASVSVCTDLLKPGGYGRPRAYFRELGARMDSAGARTISDFIIRAHGQGQRALDRLGVDAPLKASCEQALTGGADLRQAAGERVYARWVSEAKLLNTEVYVEQLAGNPHYARAQNEKPPKKIGRRLQLFDCITCDKCIPVCPNDANFAFVVPPTTIPMLKLRREGDTWLCRQEGELRVAERHQIGNFADLCNDCGNCDTFCPEDGGPYKIKPRFFGSRERWRAARTRDGFYVERRGQSVLILGRFAGSEYEVEVGDGQARYAGDGFSVTFEERNPQGTIKGNATADVDLTYFLIMDALGKAVLSSTEVNWINALEDGEAEQGTGSGLTAECGDRTEDRDSAGCTRHRRGGGFQTRPYGRFAGRGTEEGESVSERAADIRKLAERYTPDMVRFLREMIAIPSESTEERAVVERVRMEMAALGFDEIKIDGLGNVLGRMGGGRTVIAVDGHVDTVGVGDPSTWTRDPYRGELRDGVVYGRGASDQEAGVAAAVYGARIMKDLGLDEDCQLWVTGTVMEEDCDGLCWQYIVQEGLLKPDVVVLTEPTGLRVHRGHRGRMEIEVRTQGLSCHGSAPERGVNAVYKMAPIIRDIERLNHDLADRADAFLGKGSVAISAIRSTAPSLCAVADSSTIHLDRRLTRDETLESAVRQVEGLESVQHAGATVHVLDYARPSYTGLTYPTKKYYPTWSLEADHPAVVAAVRAAELALDAIPVVDKWVFSTNGVATCGMFGIPTVGFGPAYENHAHSPDDQCPVEHLTRAASFYAMFPEVFLKGRR